MTAHSERAVRDEIRVVDAELVELRRIAAELRAQIGGRFGVGSEPEEIATTITSAEEQEALIGVLEARRERLTNQLTEG